MVARIVERCRAGAEINGLYLKIFLRMGVESIAKKIFGRNGYRKSLWLVGFHSLILLVVTIWMCGFGRGS